MIVILVIAYLYIPIFITNWYQLLRHPVIYIINLSLAILLSIYLFYSYNPDGSFQEKGEQLLLMSPLIFLILFKVLDVGAFLLYERHFIITFVTIIRQSEEYNKKVYDVVGTLLLSLVPFAVPMALRQFHIL
jgi:hypothetical protein